MKRLELIANHSVEADLRELFEKEQLARHYTKIHSVQGQGNSGPRMNDHIWPEANFMLIIYCSEEEAKKIAEIVYQIKEKFAHEGVKLFESEARQI